MISQGTVTQNTGKSDPKASQQVTNGKTNTKQDPLKLPAIKYVPNFFPNPMERFASYSVLWTLAVLTPQQFNDPKSYRNGTLDFAGDFFLDANTGAINESSIIFSSGGRGDQYRTKTFYGSPEYFIDNFTMKATVAANERTGNSNAFKFEFDIYEPYSMGLLLQSMQVAAAKAGYVNYLDNAPYVLKMDMVGWDELGRKSVSVSSKYFVLKLVSMKFQVTESGSQYKVEGIPYNHQGFSDAINTTYTDLKLEGGAKGTVDEVLASGSKSLMGVLNAVEEKMLKEKLIQKKDEYVIQFPKNSSEFASNSPIPNVDRATINPKAPSNSDGVIKGTGVPVQASFLENEISTSSLGFNSGRGGDMPFALHGDAIDEKTGLLKRDNMLIDVKNRSFQFTQGQTITAMINQIILSSDYAKKALDSKNLVNGFVKWWRVDIQVELLDYDPLIGDFAKRIIYRVVPFLVHHTIFADPSSAPLGYPELQQKIVKQYNYIYTGQNVDILKFDININNLFYTGTAPSKESESNLQTTPDQRGATEPTVTGVDAGGKNAKAQAANLGRARPKRNPDLLKRPVGGVNDKTTEQVIAEEFHSALVSGASADMVTVNLEILGDPYWLVDSGMGNYFSSKADETAQITDDGSMNYESGDVFIYISFRSPVDINQKAGLYEFAKAGQDSAFSGIYRVVMCESNFSGGLWKQKLQCLRMPGQANDYTIGGKPVGVTPQQSPEVFPRRPGNPEPTKSTPQDDTSATNGFTI